MKRRILTLIGLFLPIICFAQKGSVEGTIEDSRNQEKIAFAGITLMKLQDTSLIRGVASEKDGTFIINGVANGKYLVQVYYTGFDKWTSEPVSITNEKHKVNIGTVKLIPSAFMLNAAEVTATKPPFEIKHGTITMNVESNPTAAGDNVIELLKKMPSVMVDHNDNISIEGRSGVTILIDDKPTYLSGEDLTGLLKSMSSNLVDRIEVMKKPSARYDAQGTAGIINIITKKEKKFGINGSAYFAAGYAKNPKINAGFNLTARTGKFVFSTNYSYFGYKNINGSSMINESPRDRDTIKISLNENDHETWQTNHLGNGHNFSFGTDYFINKKNVISLLYRGNLSNNRYFYTNYNRIYTNNRLDSSYKSMDNGRQTGSNHTLNLNYKHSFDSTGKALHLDFLFSHNSSLRQHDNELIYYRGDMVNEYQREYREVIKDPNKTGLFTFKADYEHPFNENMKLEAGIKTSYVHNENLDRNFVNGELIREWDNNFIYTENINAAYIIYSVIVKKIDIQLGLRGEHTFHQGELRTTGESNRQNYFDLFPNFSIGYELPKQNNLELGYRYSIFRPGYYSLNPFLNISDPYQWSTGNPNLKPQYNHSLSLNYSWKYIINIGLWYQHITDSYTNIESTDPMTGIRISRPENIGKSDYLSLNISANYTFRKWWTMNYYIGGNLGQVKLQYDDRLVIRNVRNVWYNFVESFTFLKNYSFDISGYGMLPSRDIFGKNRGQFFLNAGFKANLLKNTLTVRLTVQDILNFGGRWIEDYTYPDGSRTRGNYHWESRGVWLNISYRFGKQDIQTRQRGTESEELNRIGGGSGEGGKR